MLIFAEIYTDKINNKIPFWNHGIYFLVKIYDEYYWCPYFKGEVEEHISCILKKFSHEECKMIHPTVPSCDTYCFKFKEGDLDPPEA